MARTPSPLQAKVIGMSSNRQAGELADAGCWAGAGEIAAGLARLGPADVCTGLVNWASILMHIDSIFIRRASILLNRASTLQQMRTVIRVHRFGRGLRPQTPAFLCAVEC